MKRFLTLLIAVLLFVIAIAIGLKNQQIITINYLVAENQIHLATLFAIIFMFGFIVASVFALLFYFKLKIQNRQLRKLNKKQGKALAQLRAVPTVKKDK